MVEHLGAWWQGLFKAELVTDVVHKAIDEKHMEMRTQIETSSGPMDEENGAAFCPGLAAFALVLAKNDLYKDAADRKGQADSSTALPAEAPRRSGWGLGSGETSAQGHPSRLLKGSTEMPSRRFLLGMTRLRSRRVDSRS